MNCNFDLTHSAQRQALPYQLKTRHKIAKLPSSYWFPSPSLHQYRPFINDLLLITSTGAKASPKSPGSVAGNRKPASSLLPHKKSNAGFLMLELSLALLLSSVAAGLAFWSAHRAEMASQAMIQADQLQNIAHAAETLLIEHYQDFQSGQAVIRNGVRLEFGNAFGQALNPSLDQLRSMALGLSTGSNVGSYKSLQKASYLTQIQRVPVGCEDSKSGASCNLTGLVCLDQAVQDITHTTAASHSEIDGFGLGKMIGKIGGNAGISLIGSADQIIGAGGAWTANNPIINQPAGIICVRFGFGASGFGQFLRVHDNRDPQFQNNLTAQGNITSSTGSVGAGIGQSENQKCTLGEILNSGAFWSRSQDCIKKAWVDGQTGVIGLADNSGNTRIQLQDNGHINSLDQLGQIKAGFSYQGLQSVAKADLIVTNQGKTGLRDNGESFADSIVIQTTAVAGTSCPTNNASVWGTQQNHLRLLKCENFVWVLSGNTQAQLGETCAVNGEIGETPNKLSIICVGNVWQTTTSRMGQFATSATLLANHSSTIAKPACGSGGVAKIIQIPQTINAQKLYQNFKAKDNGSSWTTLITDGDELALSGSVLVETGCWYQ